VRRSVALFGRVGSGTTSPRQPDDPYLDRLAHSEPFQVALLRGVQRYRDGRGRVQRHQGGFWTVGTAGPVPTACVHGFFDVPPSLPRPGATSLPLYSCRRFRRDDHDVPSEGGRDGVFLRRRLRRVRERRALVTVESVFFEGGETPCRCPRSPPPRRRCRSTWGTRTLPSRKSVEQTRRSNDGRSSTLSRGKPRQRNHR